MIEILFWGSIILIFFAYLGYPFSLWFLGIFRNRPVNKGRFFPHVTMIITAHNEGKRIRGKIDNTLAVEYPKDKLQVLVASDGSTDHTNPVVEKYSGQGVELLAIEERRGKENAQREAVKRAAGDVIVFTDVATRIRTEAVREIVANFADPTVGCVSSEDRVIGTDGRPGGENLYVRYEMWLRRLESKVNSLVGLSGSFFAARKEVCRDFSGSMQSDFRTVLNSVKLGLRGVSDPGAVGYYSNIVDERREFERKVRTVLRGLTVFFSHLGLLNVFRHGLFSYQYFCHKLLRWSVPGFLLAAFVSNLILTFKSDLFFMLAGGQVFFYTFAVLGLLHEVNNSFLKYLLKVPGHFVLVNAAAMTAWWKYLRGQRMVTWTPSER